MDRMQDLLDIPHMKIVLAVARRFARRNPLPAAITLEDLIMEGWLVLRNCVERGDTSRPDWCAYLTKALLNVFRRVFFEFLGACRVPIKAGYRQGKSPADYLKGRSNYVSGLRAADETDHEDWEEEIDTSLAKLLPREERVLRERFGLGCDPIGGKAQAAAHGLSRERISQFGRKGLARLRARLELRL